MNGLASTRPVAAGACYAEAFAVIHAACFAAGERWSAHAIAGLLGSPRVAAFALPPGAFVMLRVVADEAEILTLAVAPGDRRRGHARALLQHALREAAAQGAAAMFLEVGAGNAPALALYRSGGFVEHGRRRGYYHDGSDALMLRVSLPWQGRR